MGSLGIKKNLFINLKIEYKPIEYKIMIKGVIYNMSLPLKGYSLKPDNSKCSKIGDKRRKMTL